jgi:flavodoxin
MRALVIYESMYGNTHAIADAIAEGLGGEVGVRPVHDAGGVPGDLDFLVVGGPTHMHGLSTALSRKMAVSAAKEDAGTVEPGATEEPGLREWLRGLDGAGLRAAAFDTRGDARASVTLTGSAARGIGRRLRRRGCDVIDSQSFLVEDAEGPLEDGELDRAREWGAALAQAMTQSAS